jgi:hypothetical protein
VATMRRMPPQTNEAMIAKVTMAEVFIALNLARGLTSCNRAAP